MPKHQTTAEKVHGHIRTQVTLRKGEVVSLCRCWQSKHSPICDGTHNHLDTEYGPYPDPNGL